MNSLSKVSSRFVLLGFLMGLPYQLRFVFKFCFIEKIIKVLLTKISFNSVSDISQNFQIAQFSSNEWLISAGFYHQLKNPHIISCAHITGLENLDPKGWVATWDRNKWFTCLCFKLFLIIKSIEKCTGH